MSTTTNDRIDAIERQLDDIDRKLAEVREEAHQDAIAEYEAMWAALLAGMERPWPVSDSKK